MDCVKFFADRFGAENIISAIGHKDETTPHLHLNLVPITNGKLCSKDLYDRKKLSELQTEFYEKVGKKWGLERGKFKSGAKHMTASEYKAQTNIEEATRQAENMQAENKPYQEALEQAKNGNYAWTPGGLKKQAIAATAETIKTKKENEDLTRRLDASMRETLPEGIIPYQLRHTFASVCDEKVKREVIELWMGDSPERLVGKTYVHYSDEFMRKEMDKVKFVVA